MKYFEQFLSIIKNLERPFILSPRIEHWIEKMFKGLGKIIEILFTRSERDRVLKFPGMIRYYIVVEEERDRTRRDGFPSFLPVKFVEAAPRPGLREARE